MVYARVATGYRPGGPNDVPPPPVAPARCRGNTAQTRPPMSSSGFDRRSSTAFFPSTSRPSTSIGRTFSSSRWSGGFGINGNGGTARTQGLEWTFGYVPVHGLKFQWIGAFTEANLTSPATALNASSGAQLPFAPKWTTSLDGQYEWTAFANYKGLRRRHLELCRLEEQRFRRASQPRPRRWTCRAITPRPPASALITITTEYAVRQEFEQCERHHQLHEHFGGAPYSTISVIQPRTVGVDAVCEILRSHEEHAELHLSEVRGIFDLPPYLLFLGDTTERGYAKTAFGLRDWAGERCVGEWSCDGATVSDRSAAIDARKRRARAARGRS